jgi:RHS repeat-associated protein
MYDPLLARFISADTVVPPTATPTRTNTPVPPTATPTRTNTPVPPTATNTPTNTPVPPTATNTPTNTPVPPTATNTPTNTPVPPTATNTPTPEPIQVTRVVHYTYDGLLRLIGVETNIGDDYTYSYDLVGNRTGVWVNDVRTVTQSFNAVNQVVGWTYDEAGNLLDDGTNTYIYDALNRLVEQNGVPNRYNGDGVLISTGSITYTQDLAQSLSQVLQIDDGTVTNYFYGNERLASSNDEWYVTDALGSVRQTVDDSAQVLQFTQYDPWGNVESGSINTFGFTGELQGEDGLTYLRARWYNPNHGTFISRDPFSGFDNNPYSQHPYQYAYSAPTMWTDPSGQCLGWIVFWIPNECQFAGWDWKQWGWDDGKPWAGAALDLLPVVGDVKGFVEVFVGCDLVTGEYLGYWRYAGLVPFLGQRIKAIKTIRKLDDIPVDQFRKMLGAGDELPPPRSPDGPPPKDPDVPLNPCKLNSFSADTLVSTEHGLVPISEIEVGDLVWAWNEETGETGLYPVTDTMVHIDPVIVHLTIGDETIETTPEHPFYTLERGWVDAADLHFGDRIIQLDGEIDPVLSITLEQRSQPMYNLTVDVAHTFFVGEEQWLVHNANGCDKFLEKIVQILPNRNGTGKTSGYLLDTNGNIIGDMIVSGTHHPYYNDKTLVREDTKLYNIQSHVEAQAAGIMRDNNIEEAVLVLNNHPCEGQSSCSSLLELMVPIGARLRVIVPQNFDDRGVFDTIFMGR